MDGKVTRARELRRDSTYPEKICWELLRAHRMSGIKFRRQHPIGPYFADFACTQRKLVIEIDGEHHVVRKHDVIFLPPGVEHSIANSGVSDLVFLVVKAYDAKWVTQMIAPVLAEDGFVVGLQNGMTHLDIAAKAEMPEITLFVRQLGCQRAAIQVDDPIVGITGVVLRDAVNQRCADIRADAVHHERDVLVADTLQRDQRVGRLELVVEVDDFDCLPRAPPSPFTVSRIYANTLRNWSPAAANGPENGST